MDKTTRRFIASVLEHLPEELTSEEMKEWIENPPKLRRFLSALSQPMAEVTTIQGLHDSVILVDRGESPIYPSWLSKGKMLLPELENTGPEKFEAAKLDLSLQLEDTSGVVLVETVYKYLQVTNTLTDCLDLRALEEIQKKGIVFYRRYFDHLALFGWKSAGERGSAEDLVVPYLVKRSSKVVLDWSWFGNNWRTSWRTPRIVE